MNGPSGRLTGHRGLVVGIANDRSIAWGIADAMRQAGAELAITYQGDTTAKRVRPLAERLAAPIIAEADVQNPATLDALFDEIANRWGTLDFLVHSIAYSSRDELTGRFVDTSLANFQTSLEISCYSLIELARRAKSLMPTGGSIITLTYQGSNRVTPFYNVMGVAKAALESSVRYLANDLGESGIRVNAISPGPMRTLAGAAIGGARKSYRHTERNAPLRANPTLEAVGATAVYLASDDGACTTGDIIMVDCGYHVLGMPQVDNI